jgi:hypothetical protein
MMKVATKSLELTAKVPEASGNYYWAKSKGDAKVEELKVSVMFAPGNAMVFRDSKWVLCSSMGGYWARIV